MSALFVEYSVKLLNQPCVSNMSSGYTVKTSHTWRMHAFDRKSDTSIQILQQGICQYGSLSSAHNAI